MRKFEIRLNFGKEIQTIVAENWQEAKKKALIEKGYKCDDVVFANIRQVFNDEKSIEEICAKYYKQFEKKPIELVEYWEGGNNVHLDILRPDGYYESIYFTESQIKIAERLFEKLSNLYNREPTPLEKYQGSF